MKTWMKVVLGIFAGIAVLLGLIFWLTGDISKAGSDFFAAAANDDVEGAYALLSSDFQATTSKEELDEYLEKNGLDNVTDTSWSSRSISGSTGSLEGTLTTAKGDEIPIKLKLVNSDAGWKIQSISKEQAGFQNDKSSSRQPLPSKLEAMSLTKATTSDFVEGMRAPTMEGFYGTFSSQFRRDVSLQKLEEGFGGFKGKNFDMLNGYTPVFSNTGKINDAGILSIDGYYKTSPRLKFTYEYIFEGVKWKLWGIDIEAIPLEELGD